MRIRKIKEQETMEIHYDIFRLTLRSIFFLTVHIHRNMVIITDSGSNNKEDNMLSEATVINDTIFLSSKEEENILRGFG